MFSLLKPRGRWLYLTDGGHIDNTGLYVLLQRRCSHIIVIDAEADPYMTFASFVRVQRYARIDLGVRINLRWDKIAATSLGARASGAEPARGPHCAVGEIIYSDGGKGKLIYVKASLSDDENVYVRDYARRYADYPHETTGDQFFSEEQFEVYRALGFHCVHGIYKSDEPDEIEVSTSGVEVKGTVTKPVERAVLPARAEPVRDVKNQKANLARHANRFIHEGRGGFRNWPPHGWKGRGGGRGNYSFKNSPHFGAGSVPQGMIGTVEVEFCGLPSMILSV